MKQVPHYNNKNTSVTCFAAHTAPWANVQLIREYQFHPNIYKLVSEAGYNEILIPMKEGKFVKFQNFSIL